LINTRYHLAKELGNHLLLYMPPFSKEIRDEIKERDGEKCFGCDKPSDSVHHVCPESFGGVSNKENGLFCCRECHDVLDHLVIDMGVTPFGPLNELSDEFFRHGNPFKDIPEKDFWTLKRDDFIRIVGRHKKKK